MSAEQAAKAEDWSQFDEAEPSGDATCAEEQAWPKPDLRIVPPPEAPKFIADDPYIDALVKAGFAVVSYRNAHRSPDGRPRWFGPSYPL